MLYFSGARVLELGIKSQKTGGYPLWYNKYAIASKRRPLCHVPTGFPVCFLTSGYKYVLHVKDNLPRSSNSASADCIDFISGDSHFHCNTDSTELQNPGP
ncbi:hypothetical protein GYMLUDRAFT_505014 [Collybiopsis luxurians FD-317 M1]|uniref:Uncharacterized protein n=1 Tax=Collybiopsis luxurians FD-317 M1 TaxID=944289 RepID=A0A0D0C397_9AGAR|nr:hypothetical protein GYMLUDRAFT_505014 [Collybiopsis luxurians FD-317 M1]